MAASWLPAGKTETPAALLRGIRARCAAFAHHVTAFLAV